MDCQNTAGRGQKFPCRWLGYRGHCAHVLYDLVHLQMTNSTRVCSVHFKEADFKTTLTGKRTLEKYAVPSMFCWSRSPREQQGIEELAATLHKQTIYIQLKMKPNSNIRFYTGFPSFDVLVPTFRALKHTEQNTYFWSQMQHLRNKGIGNVEGLRKTMQGCKLSLFVQFYLVLQKLRVGNLNQVLVIP